MSGRSAHTRLLLTADAVGGVWQYATDLARALAPLGVETVLALLGPAPSAEMRAAARAIPGATLIETGLPLDWLADSPEEVQLAGRRLAELAAHVGADIVQLNQPALADGAQFPVPVIAVAHSCLATWWAATEQAPPPEAFAWRIAQHARGLRAADRVVAPSAAFAAATSAAYALAASPLVVHNGRAPLTGPPAEMRDVGFTAGRLWDRAKDLATIDRAAARTRVPIEAAGALAGPNGEAVRLDHVRALGRIDEAALGACLAARPVFVSAARYEPFGLAVLEAAAAGCALVLADIPTFRELWDGAAMFVAPADDGGFAEAIDRLVGDPSMRLRSGEQARAAAARYTPGRMAAAMAELYAEVRSDAARAAA